MDLSSWREKMSFRSGTSGEVGSGRVPPLFCSIVPPHILVAIAEHGTSAQRESAWRTITMTEQLRGQRLGMTGSKTMALQGMLFAGPKPAQQKTRLIYTADNSVALPGRDVRSEGAPPSGDQTVNEAYDGSGATYDFYQKGYGRNSVDGKGMRLDSTVHYERGYDNAFWNGRQMVYGDGDEDLPPGERVFNRFTVALDVIGHELTHGVTQFEASLVYWDQPGALNESLSDVFGSLVKQMSLNQTASQADWIIGKGLFTARVNAKGIRSMKDPGTAYDDPLLNGKDPQPAHMRDYVNTSEDNGGVHLNSGIPNRAFYLTAAEIGGHAWERAGHIWYVALCDKLGSRSDFRHAARMTKQVAAKLYGPGSAEAKAVRKAWTKVGIKI